MLSAAVMPGKTRCRPVRFILFVIGQRFSLTPFTLIRSGRFHQLGDPAVDRGQPCGQVPFLDIADHHRRFVVRCVETKLEPLYAAAPLLVTGDVLSFSPCRRRRQTFRLDDQERLENGESVLHRPNQLSRQRRDVDPRTTYLAFLVMKIRHRENATRLDVQEFA
jgi:hypothetical protein